MADWKLRYRSSLAKTRGVDEVLIQTTQPDYTKAKQVADFWLSKHRAHPSTRFVSLEPNCVQTEADMDKELKAQKPTAA